jgi:hypothetical protein
MQEDCCIECRERVGWMVERAVTIPLNAVRVSVTFVGGVMRLIQLRHLNDIFLAHIVLHLKEVQPT